MNEKDISSDELSMLKTAHKTCFKNAEIISKSQRCGCFYCLQIYESSLITDSDCVEESDGQYTVFCPKCGIDSVISDQSGYLTPDFLQKMKNYYFWT